MFWGLVLEPGKRYTQTVERAFHVSMACLEANAVDTDIVSVVLEDQAKKQFILCNLHKQKVIQAQLDLNFQSGDILSFSATGKGKVHLTGYLLEPDDDEDEEDESDGNDLSLEELENLTKDLKTGKRKKGSEGATTPDLKKPKIDSVINEVDDSDEDDEDYEVGAEDKESGEDVDDEEDEGGEEEDDDEDDDDDDDDVEEKEEDVVTPQPKAESKKKEKQDIKTPNKQKNNAQQKQDGKTPRTPSGTPQVNGNQQSGKKNKKGETPKSKSPTKMHLEGGVIIEEMTEGNGPVAKRGKQVTVYYVGRLMQNNKQFDCTTQGPGFKFRLGRGEVIRGWDIGVAGMKVGGKRKIICPAAMGYGTKGSPPVIPPNSTLVFDVELKGVN